MPHLPSPFPHAGPPLPGSEPLTLETSDGERLSAVHVPRPAAKGLPQAPARSCIVVAHGFTGAIERPAHARRGPRFVPVRRIVAL